MAGVDLLPCRLCDWTLHLPFLSMASKPFSPLSLPMGNTTAVVQQFNRQLLQCVEDEALSAAQQAELLAWAHGHLLVAHVALRLDDLTLLAAESADSRFVNPCHSAVNLINHMLQGGVPLEDDLTFRCPPVCCPCADVLHARLLAWMRQRVRLAAQRTRWHTDAELDRLWQAVEAHLLVDSLVEFELADCLDADVPSAETLEAMTSGCLEAMRAGRGLAWTPAGAVLGNRAT